MDFFHTPPRCISQQHLSIDGEEFDHLTRVLRHTAGDHIMVVDGVGCAYEVRIERTSRTSARCEIIARHPGLHEHPATVVLGVALLKNPSRFDYLVEKATELGVHTIVPLITERTIAQHAKTDRWKKLGLVAMKQSQRCVLPSVHRPSSLEDFFATASSQGAKIMAHESATTLLPAQVSGKQSFAVCIGPEGGFTESEVRAAGDRGFAVVSLGPRRLRTETAAVAILALLTQ